MKTLGNIGLVALLTVVGSVSLGCSSQGGESGTDEGAATVGVPAPAVMGELIGNDIHFKRTADAQGAPIPPVEYTRQTQQDYQNGLLVIKDPAPPSGAIPYGTGLNKHDPREQTLGWFTNTPWKCQAAERFVFNEVRTLDVNQECYVDINPTGGNTGLSAIVIGLDASRDGLTSWSGSPTAEKPKLVNGGAVFPVGTLSQANLANKVNLTIDADKVLEAMKAVQQEFKIDAPTRNDCLKNARAGGWLDIQAHYYCLLPYGSLRTCYSQKLVDTRKPDVAYGACIENGSAEGKWVHTTQGHVFKYIMFTQQGAADFNLESENEPINDFYKSLGVERPRRALDTFPKWLPDQPRYEVIRKAQVAAQAKGG